MYLHLECAGGGVSIVWCRMLIICENYKRCSARDCEWKYTHDTNHINGIRKFSDMMYLSPDEHGRCQYTYNELRENRTRDTLPENRIDLMGRMYAIINIMYYKGD